MTEELYIDDQESFEQLCSELAACPRLALDTEFERRNTYYPVLALLQIASEEKSILIDPLNIDDWRPLTTLFDSDILFVMHSCSEDLEVFRKHLGTQPRWLMDTQIACAFLGKGDSLGYANMVMTMCQVEIDKSETRSNWLQRPLTPSQQLYAREDVRWLLDICTELEAELSSLGRLEWVQQECAHLRDKYWQEPDIDSQWLRIKGLGRIDSRAWPLAYALANWREERSRKLDKPRGWIMKDPELLEIAQRRPRNRQQLSQIKALSPVTMQRNLDRVLSLTNANDLPEPNSFPAPELSMQERGILKRCQRLVGDKAEQLNMSARCLASKQDISELIQIQDKGPDARSTLKTGWRHEVIGHELDQLIAGA